MKIRVGASLIVCMLCVSMYGAAGSVFSKANFEDADIISSVYTSNIKSNVDALETTVYKYLSMDANSYKSCEQTQMDICLPWMDVNIDSLLEWWVRLEYNGQTFDKQVEISIGDFSEKFLKHPEYGEILYFDIDSDPADDVEVIVGFYWSVIRYPDGTDARSLESRFRVRQMPDGGIEDEDGELEVWSDLRVNYALINTPGKSKSLPHDLSDFRDVTNEDYQPGFFLKQFIEKLENRKVNERFTMLGNIFKKILSNFVEGIEDATSNNANAAPLTSDDDYISIGSGYRSPEGQKIPLLVEKRFSFAKSLSWSWKDGNLFNPTVFQHKMDPGGTDPIELLYGFQAYDGTSDKVQYDIAFSVEFDPAVYLITKFVPTDGLVYYYFDQKSYSGETKVTFSADILKGSGEDVPSLSLTFDRIDNNLARSGRWLMFDLDLINGDLLGGGFHYKASHKHSVAIEVNAFGFEEKVKMDGLPTSIDFGWDVDLDLNIVGWNNIVFGGGIELDMNGIIDGLTIYYPKSESSDTEESDVTFIEINDIPSIDLDARASLDANIIGLLTVKPSITMNLDMSSSPGEINVYYPKPDPNNDPDSVFINIPDGSIPSKVELGAEAIVNVDIENLLNPSNYVYGRIWHDCDKNMDEICVYLPNFAYDLDENVIPLFKVTDIPADASAEGKLNWGTLSGHALATRGYIGGFDPIEVNLEYGGFEIYNKLEIREGYISTSFKIAENGYFNFDTSNKILGNTLRVSSSGEDISLKRLELVVDEVSADNLQADWDIDTSGEQPKINNLDFNGFIDTIKGLHFNLNLEGKSSSLDFDWVTGQAGYVELDFHQDDPIRLDFNLDDQAEGVDFHGHVELTNNPHFDLIWDWKQGDSYDDPGYFKINENTNEEIIEEMYLYFTYQDMWGAETSLSNAGVYVCIEWYWYNLLLYIWPVIDVYGDVDLNLLLNGEWYYNVEDWINPP